MARFAQTLAHNAKVKTDMPKKNEKELRSPCSQSGRLKGRRTMEQRICREDEFWAWSGREKELWMVTVVMKEMTNWC